MLEQSILMILKLLLNTQMMCMMSIKTMEDATQIKSEKYLLYLMIYFIIFFIIADILSDKKINPILADLFIRGRELNISLVFIIQSYFAVATNIRLNSTHYLVIKIPNKKELQQSAFNHSSDIDFQDFMNLYKKCTDK